MTGTLSQVRDERQQRHLASPLDRLGKHALVLRARPGRASRMNLATLADETLQQLDVLVVDELDLLNGEVADLALWLLELSTLRRASH